MPGTATGVRVYRSNLLFMTEFSPLALSVSNPGDYTSEMVAPGEGQSWNGLIDRLLRPRQAAGENGAKRGRNLLPEPRLLGLRMAALYRSWQQNAGPDLGRLTEGLLADIGLAAGAPLACTCRAAAEAVSRWKGSAYHSARHHAEVATNAMVVAAISSHRGYPLPRHDLGLLLAAALAHDIYWNSEAAQTRFAAETRSAEALADIAAECGVAAADRAAMRVLVMVTDPQSRADLAGLVDGTGTRRELLPPLASVAGNQRLLRLAALLSDADLLSSAGLTLAWTRVQGERLSVENQAPLGTAVWQHFFDAIVGPNFLSVGGQHFAPNLARIRRSTSAMRSDAR